MRLLRKAGLVTAIRGKNGGYVLTDRPEDIRLNEALEALDERLKTPCACDKYMPAGTDCVHSGNCSIRALWTGVDGVVQAFLSRFTLADLMQEEREIARGVSGFLKALPS